MDYQIIATLGPGSTDPSLWSEMLSVGVTAFRLNTSHLNLDELHTWLERLGGFLDPLEPRPAVVLDLQGSKWRLGEFPSSILAAGQRVRLVCAAVANRPDELPVPHADFFAATAISNGKILLNDARVSLVVEECSNDTMTARVVQGGELLAHKGVTLESSSYRQERLGEKDQSIFEQTHGLDFVRYAISYIKDAAEMARYRANFGSSASLIAKLERGGAVAEAERIAHSADELWLCRGDLGAELGLKGMAEAAARFSEEVNKLPVPALLAGQVLEHMKDNPIPTRSEVSYLYEALLKGYRGVVLSDETAVGKYPLESCRAAALFRE
jgi:pyruvate kinase